MALHPVLVIAALFIVSFLLSPLTLLVLSILVCTLSEAMMNRAWRSRIVYLASLALASMALHIAAGLLAPGRFDYYHSLLVVTLLSLVAVAVYAYRAQLNNVFIYGRAVPRHDGLPAHHRLHLQLDPQAHQRDRILSFLGIISDPLGTTTTSISRRSPSARAAGSARVFWRALRSSTASSRSAIPTSSFAR